MNDDGMETMNETIQLLGIPVSGNLHPFIVLESYGKMDMNTSSNMVFFCAPVGATGVDGGVNLGDSYAAGRDGGTWYLGRGEEYRFLGIFDGILYVFTGI